MDTSEITIPNDITYLPAVQAYAEEVSRLLGFNKKDISMILLALEEAVTNVIKHAFEKVENATFKIIFKPKSTCLTIIVKDKGLPYEPELIHDFNIDEAFEHKSVPGLGSLLMKKSVDEVSFYNLGREGKELHLTKYLPFKKITAYRTLEEIEAFPPITKTVSGSDTPIKTEIRLMKPDEAIEVSRLFYRCYGYSYFMDAIYYPDKLARLISEGKIISAVSVTGENEIVGHVGVVRSENNSRIAEVGMAATKPSFRGLGSMGKMVSFLMEESRKAGLEGLFGEAVCFHTYSQKVGYASGFKDCAILLGITPKEEVFKGIMENAPQRGSIVYSFLPLISQKTPILYAPPWHMEFIKGIYRNLDIDAGFAVPEEDKSCATKEQCIVKTDIYPSDNRAEIKLACYGLDVLDKTKGIMKDLKRRRLDQVSLYLDLEHPMSVHLCGEFEKMGFFIAGVMPMLYFNHTLILQYLNNISLDYSQIKLYSEFAKNMLNYIKEHTLICKV